MSRLQHLVRKPLIAWTWAAEGGCKGSVRARGSGRAGGDEDSCGSGHRFPPPGGQYLLKHAGLRGLHGFEVHSVLASPRTNNGASSFGLALAVRPGAAPESREHSLQSAVSSPAQQRQQLAGYLRALQGHPTLGAAGAALPQPLRRPSGGGCCCCCCAAAAAVPGSPVAAAAAAAPGSPSSAPRSLRCCKGCCYDACCPCSSGIGPSKPCCGLEDSWAERERLFCLPSQTETTLLARCPGLYLFIERMHAGADGQNLYL
ncbi:uncharacterized protein LOC141561392 [Sminthopsis crassicaudata]|uniref:uncharacterized protein LOC141561392 n=1 Tax=Sminthopsis crassicaudata TaxID=9301 RepID=UPI003D68B79F